MKHARASASQAYIWMVCAGSVRASAPFPRQATFYSAEGTVAHKLAAELVNWGRIGAVVGDVIEEDGFEIEVTPEMVEAIGLYTEAVNTRIAEAGDAQFRYNVEVDLTPALKRLDPDLGGNSDTVLYFPRAQILSVWDFKYGAGIPVEVVDNEQGLVYAIGALLGTKAPIKTVEISICQPRYAHSEGVVRTWSFPAVDILAFAADLVEKVRATREPNAPLKSGEHCRFCPAAATCPELDKTTTAMIATEFGALVADPVKLAKALDMIPELLAKIKAVHALAYEQAIQGHEPPGYKLVAKRATRKWDNPAAVAGLVAGKAEWFEEPKLLSPTQVEKQLGAAAYGLVESHVEKQSSGLALVHESDKRPKAQTAAALADEFDAVPAISLIPGI